jgi:TonB family protein
LPDSAHRTPEVRAPARAPARARAGVPQKLVLLTHDRVLFQTVRTVCASHGLSTVSSEADLASELAAGTAGVVIVDAAAAASPIAELTGRLAAQFPDLVLIVAGDSRHQNALTSEITTGTVHRFLHKPLSEQRVRLFVEAAWRRHEQEQLDPPLTPSVAAPPGPAPRSSRRPLWMAGIAAALVASSVAAWFFLQRSGPAGPELTASASHASYRQAASLDGTTSELDRLLDQADAALQAQKIDEAEELAAAARTLEPHHVRVAFLATQIGKERERELLTRAREAAAAGNVEAAIALLDTTGASQGSTVVAETRRELEQKRLEEQVTSFLQRAEERALAGALVEPARDNARFFIQSAQALAPASESVRAARQRLGGRLLANAQAALGGGEATEAERWLDAAQESGADAARIAELRRDLQRARTANRAANLARVLASFNERLEQNQLREPAGDNARHWLARLMASDPASTSTRNARDRYAERALAAGTAAVARKDFAAADEWLTEARTTGAASDDTAALEGAILRGRQASSVLDASALQRVRYFEPRFPDDARKRGTDGWVELEFTVGTDGTVGKIAVTRSEPAGLFDSAAVNAVRRWRYRPVMSDGAAVEQRARVRIRFTLE